MLMRGRILAVALLMLGVCASPAQAAQAMQDPVVAQQVFIGIEGSKGPFVGESARVQNRIEALELNQLLGTSGKDGQTSASAATRQLGLVRFTKLAGAADVQLYQALISGESLQSVVIDFVLSMADGRMDVLQSITLRDARVTGIERVAEADGKGGTRWREEVSLAYGRFEIRDHRIGAVAAQDLRGMR